MGRSLSHWVEYIQTLHPRTIDLTLERVAKVWSLMKPEQMPPVIAIAGTNGKGSSVSMLESIYRQANYRTGAFTSPHLVHFNERICLNNIPVDDDRLVEAFEHIEAIRADTSLTFFEFNTLLALEIFCSSELDVILLEVGLGGRLDAVNIVENDLALITAIDIDHSAWLGDDREQIGVEKAGIIKQGKHAVIADPDAPASLAQRALQQNASYVQAGLDYHIHENEQGVAEFVSEHPQLKAFNGLGLQSEMQHVLENRAGIIATIAKMADVLPVSKAQIRAGLEKQSLPGRLQLLETKPRVLLDVSHNEASVLTMLGFIDQLQPEGEIHAVFGALADKDYGEAYERLKARVTSWYLTTISGERGQSASELAGRLFDENDDFNGRMNLHLTETPQQAFEQAKSSAKAEDLLLIFGSFHVVGGILPHLVD